MNQITFLMHFQVVIAAITGWLWAEHEDCFQSAFIKSGRIDVDPECKWLIYTAVDESIMSMHRALDMKGSSKLEEEFSDYEIACVICNNLMRDICIDDDMVRLRSFPKYFMY